ncbi:HRDC domain-containing protein [Clostridium sp.]|uniref:HRDC domain-containing protein n=1 Tax=Clostridium sp. TaxID=1506 RepID=UPI00260433BD|nr:HRDC domain-containing protein [Clostridium sp.]
MMKFFTDKLFENSYKTVVVLSNPKTILNSKFAKKEIKNKVIRTDQLVSYIKDTYNKSKEPEMSDKALLSWAESFLKIHKEKETSHLEKYNKYLIENNEEYCVEDNINIIKKTKNKYINSIVNIEDTEIYKELKSLRLVKSREEKIKPYFIYNNEQLKDLISKMPVNNEELKNVSGFGDIKISKYGEDIISIIKKYL